MGYSHGLGLTRLCASPSGCGGSRTRLDHSPSSLKVNGSSPEHILLSFSGIPAGTQAQGRTDALLLTLRSAGIRAARPDRLNFY